MWWPLRPEGKRDGTVGGKGKLVMTPLAQRVHPASCLTCLPQDVTVLSPLYVVGSPAFNTAHLFLRLWADSRTLFFHLINKRMLRHSPIPALVTLTCMITSLEGNSMLDTSQGTVLVCFIRWGTKLFIIQREKKSIYDTGYCIVVFDV